MRLRSLTERSCACGTALRQLPLRRSVRIEGRCGARSLWWRNQQISYLFHSIQSSWAHSFIRDFVLDERFDRKGGAKPASINNCRDFNALGNTVQLTCVYKVPDLQTTKSVSGCRIGGRIGTLDDKIIIRFRTFCGSISPGEHGTSPPRIEKIKLFSPHFRTTFGSAL